MKPAALHSPIEPLEARVAPATLSGQALTYTDIDGDRVTITISKGTLAPSMFSFDTGGVTGDNSARQQLQGINIAVEPTCDGANISMAVVKGAQGDGLAAIGRINATGRFLGAISLEGDLGDLDAGPAPSGMPAIKSFVARTLGAYGLSTQGGSGNLEWSISGDVGSMKIAGDVKSCHVAIFGTLGPVTIGGSMIGGDTIYSGSLGTTGGIGSVKIGRDIRGGAGFGSGLISTEFNLASVTVGGSVVGGAGVESGELRSVQDMGAVKIRGSLVGGTGDASGRIDCFGDLASLTIGGSLIGAGGSHFTFPGPVSHEGQIFAIGNIGPVKIAGDVVGGRGGASAEIRSHGALASVIVGGSVLGSGFASAQIAAESAMGPVKIGGSMVGGPDPFSGFIHGYASVASVTVGGSVVSGAGQVTGYISGDGSLGAVTVRGSFIGGATNSGGLYSGSALGAVKVGGNVVGSTNPNSGIIQAVGNIPAVNIGGSLIGGSGSNYTGVVVSYAGSIGAVKIGRDLIGGSLPASAPNADASGYIDAAQRIGSISIGGSVVTGIDNSGSGALTRNGGIRAGENISAVTVKGNLIGNVSPNGSTLVQFIARGAAAPTATADVAIGKVAIGGRVEHAQIAAGYTLVAGALSAVNGNAQIGSVKVGGDWAASDLIAGIVDTDGDGFGDDDDAVIGGGVSIAKIAAILIKGVVTGDHTSARFGFTSHTIGFFQALGFKAAFSGGADIIELAPITGDVTIREI
jgi:hypothetical protein